MESFKTMQTIEGIINKLTQADLLKRKSLFVFDNFIQTFGKICIGIYDRSDIWLGEELE